jgi:predicted peroxiredoxin
LSGALNTSNHRDSDLTKINSKNLTEEEINGKHPSAHTHGPEHPTRAALGFHVAKAAIDEGHSVTMFLAGDGVQLMRDGAIDSVKGLGTGNLRELYDAVVAAGTKIYMSKMSSKARGLSEDELKGKPYEFGYPSDLVRLAVEHDRLFTY